MAEKNFCELCGKAGLSRRLVPYQMNTEEAIFICENSECVYPLGNPHVGSFVVCRKATEISNTKRKRKKILSKNNPENSSLKSTTSTQEQFINWDNVDALCWLDCTLSLLVHNTTIKNLISTTESSNSLLRSLLNCYTKAQELVLSDLSGAKKILTDVRHNVWTYLAPKMKCSLGVNDSPIFALPLLLKENGGTLKNCLQDYSWEFGCDACGFVEKTRHKKHLVTYPNTPKDFDFEKATFLRTCPNCKSADQKSTIVHEKMPDLVLMHFVEGLISQDYLDSKFVFNNSTYQLTQFLQYARNPDHFICWSKENDGTRWLELDDLKPSVCSWSSSTPQVPPSEVHVVVFEKIHSESRGNKLTLEENKSEKIIDNKNGILVPPTEISMNSEISFSKAEVYKEESISCRMDSLEVIQDVEEKETTSTGNNRIESKLISTDLKQKMGAKEILTCASASGTHDCDTPERCPLKDCSNTPDKTVTTPHPTKTSLQPDKTPVVPRKTPSQLSSSLTSSNLDNSLFKVALKKYSYSKTFQPSLGNKRRALSSQFLPYVPKKQRVETQIVHNKPSVLDFDNHSDSGYSSPSSVSSCGSASSTTSMETEHKMSVTDDMDKMEIDDSSHENIAEELEKLLPDCLLDDCRKRIQEDDDDEQLIHSQTMKLESVSQEQDDFIRNLLFDD